MRTTVLTAATAEPVSYAEAKTHLRLDHDDDQPYVEQLIAAARLAAERFINRSLAAQTLRGVADAWDLVPVPGTSSQDILLHPGSRFTGVRLPYGPVNSITGVRVYSGGGVAAVVSANTYQLVEDVFLAAPGQSLPTPGLALGGIEVDFEVGYATLPADLKQAILLLVAEWYDGRGSDAMTVMTEAAIRLLERHRVRRLR